MGRILEDVEIEFLRKCKKARIAAIKQAAKEIAEDFKKKVFNQAVDNYYDEYQPTKYKNRTKELYNVFEVTSRTQGEDVYIKFTWDFRRMAEHSSNSHYHKSGDEWKDFFKRDDSEDNGIPENAWIFENFMEGIHPRYYYDKKLGIVLNDSFESKDASWKRIKAYKEDYVSKDFMHNILSKALKEQFRIYVK